MLLLLNFEQAFQSASSEASSAARQPMSPNLRACGRFPAASWAAGTRLEPPFPYERRLMGNLSTALSASPLAQWIYR